MNMKLTHTLIAALYLLLSATAWAEQVVWTDRIVAVVNDDVITETEFRKQFANVLKQVRAQTERLPPEDVLRTQVLERMILARLQLQLAEKSGLKIDDTSLDRAVEGIAKQNNFSMQEFRRALDREGYDYGDFREDLRRDMTVARLRQREVENRINITEQEVDHFLTTQATQGSAEAEYRLAHILIAVPEGSSPAHVSAYEQEARAIIERLQQGADFAAVAMEKSSGAKALEGGDLGWRKLGQLPTLFADEAQRMKIGEISQPIRSPSGFHIIKLIEKRNVKEERSVIQQTLARHILVRPRSATEGNEARLRIERLYQRLANGEDFAALATANSDDKASAINGGDLGWVSPNMMVPEFEEKMNEVAKGAFSKPFESRFGWHIVQVLDRRDHDNTEEMRRDKARALLRERRIEEEYQLWLRRLRDEAFVEIRTPTQEPANSPLSHAGEAPAKSPLPLAGAG
ncbi:MAG: peptidylprolyl isomerase [Pseudomonadota bacterium]